MKVTTDQITETVAATAEPLTVAEAKSHLRVDVTDDDTLISAYISAATEYCEDFTGRSFVTRTYRADLPYFADCIVLPGRPIQAITSVYYYDTASPAALTLLAASNYTLVNNIFRRAYGATWPSVAYRDDAIQISYTAGYAPTSSPEVAAESVPEALKCAIRLITADLYENREAQFVGFSVIQENRAAKMLLQPYRVYL